MAKGILLVESQASSPELAAEYHAWYERHIEDICAVEGFVAARRYAPIDGEGPFVAVYDIEADDIAEARKRLGDPNREKKAGTSDALSSDPPPVTRFFEEIYSFEA